jgi:cytidylate kinase
VENTQKYEALVVAVDGPSGTGKSSVSRAVASRLGLRYLDTGAMYRAMTWWMLNNGVDVHDAEAVAGAAEKPQLVSGTDPLDPTIHVDGTDVAAPIRTQEVTGAVSAVSAVPAVRARLVDLQRAFIGTGGIVVEGRDITTVVAPDAQVKLYLNASEEARAARRSGELVNADAAKVQADLARRDKLDSSRAHSPLTLAEDAVEVDTTHLTRDEVIEHVLKLIEGRVG